MFLINTRRSKFDIIFRKPIYFFFLSFVFFPYISFISLGTDMQPYSLFFAFSLFFCFKMKFSKVYFSLLIVFLWSFLLLLISGLNFVSIRSLYNYMSLFLISYSSYHVLKTERLNFEYFLKFSILMWVLVGFVQVFFNPLFLNFLISDSRTTEGRGVTGLAPEPTFYGIVLIFFLIFTLHLNYKHKKLFIFLCILGIVFFAKSSMAFLFLLILLFYYLLTHLTIKYFLFAVFSLGISFLLILDYMSDSRLSFLIIKIFENPRALVLVDASINDRFFHVFFSVKGFFDNFFFPNGFGSWNDYVSNQLPNYSDFVIIEWFSIGDRIMSGYGSAFFELGIVSILIPFVLTVLLFSIYRGNLKKFLFYFLFINTIMFSAIPIGFSLFAFYIGFLSFLLWKKKKDLVHYV